MPKDKNILERIKYTKSDPPLPRFKDYCKRGFSIRQIMKAERISHGTVIYLLKAWNLKTLYSECYIKDIRELAGYGFTNKEIAKKLKLGVATIYRLRKKHYIPAKKRKS